MSTGRQQPRLMAKRTLNILTVVVVAASLPLGFLPRAWRLLAISPLLVFGPFIYQAIRYNRWLNNR